MVAIDRDDTEKSIGWIRKHRGATFMEQLAFMVARLEPWGLDPRRLIRRLQDQARRDAPQRELDLLNDHYLDDLGFKRRSDPRTDDLVNRLRWGG